MASYRLDFKRSVAKDLRAIANADVKRILKRIELLAEDPRPPGCEKLSTRECFRIREGSYRIVYEIVEHALIVMVIRVSHRRDVYRR